MNWICGIVIFGGGLTCLALVALGVVWAWRGDPIAPAPGASVDRWRRMHIEADRRAPFKELSRSDAWSGANFKIKRRA